MPPKTPSAYSDFPVAVCLPYIGTEGGKGASNRGTRWFDAMFAVTSAEKNTRTHSWECTRVEVEADLLICYLVAPKFWVQYFPACPAPITRQVSLRRFRWWPELLYQALWTALGPVRPIEMFSEALPV